MTRPRSALRRGVLRALLLAGSLCAGPAGAADTDAARALMGLAEDRQRAQDAARVLDRLAPGPTASPPATVAATRPEPPKAAAPPATRVPAEAQAALGTAIDPVSPIRKDPPARAPATPMSAVVGSAVVGSPVVVAPPPVPPAKEVPPTKSAVTEPNTSVPVPKPVLPSRTGPAPAKPAPPEREPPRPAVPEKPAEQAPAVVAALPPSAAPPRQAQEPGPVRPMAGAEVYFGYGSVALGDEAVAALLPLGEDRAGTGIVTILGHADALEKDTLDRKLSERRAEAVRRFLVATLGFDPKRLVVRGVGADRPKVKGDLPSPQNRRVEILAAPVSPSLPARPSSDRAR